MSQPIIWDLREVAEVEEEEEGAVGVEVGAEVEEAVEVSIDMTVDLLIM